MAAGSIVIDILARTASFETDTKRAEKRLKDFEKTAKVWGAAIGTAAVAAGAAFAAWTVKVAESGKELDRFSQLSNTSAETFQKWAYGAKSVGIEQEKLSDILKDVQDRVGDFITTGGGPMADFFEQIAPKVGLTAESFRNLSGPDALGLYVSSLEKAGLTQSEMIFYMEAMASDSSLLIPLLKDNAAAMSALGTEAERLGIVMSDSTVAAAKQLDENLTKLGAMLDAVNVQIANEIVPTLTSFAGVLINTATETGGVKAAIDVLVKESGLINFIEAAMMGMARLADVGVALGKVFGIISNAIELAYSSAKLGMGYVSSLNPFGESNEAQLQADFAKTQALAKKHIDSMADLWTYEGDRISKAMAQSLDMTRINREFGYLQILADPKGPTLGANIVRPGSAPTGGKAGASGKTERSIMADSLDEMLIRMGELDEAIDGTTVKFEDSTSQMGEFAVQAARNIQSSLGDGLYNILKGNFDDIGASFGDMILRMAADAAAANLAQALFGNYGNTGQIGGILGNIAGSLFGGASSGNLTGSSLSGATWGETYTFANGGYTGAGGKYEPAGIVHAGEFVLRQEAVKRIGIPRLEAMNRGYADGGLVGGVVGSGSVGSPIINVTNKGTPQGVDSSNARFDGRQWVIDIVMSDIRQNGMLGRTLRNNGAM